ncbi:MAG: hypothetical protein H7836_04460 [Magnetococcus sp. YQC-3]
MNPYDKSRGHNRFAMPTANSDQPSSDNTKVFEAMQTTDKPQQSGPAARVPPTKVSFPPHLYIPEGAESIDLRKVVSVPIATVDAELFSFTAPPGAVVRFIKYGVFNDGLLASDYQFKPLLAGSRVFRYHGDPTDNYRIALGLGPDLSESSMIPCQIVLQPNQTFQWLVTNNSAVATAMGVRMVGYLDTSLMNVTPRF